MASIGQRTIPIWIYVYSSLLIISSVVGIYGGYVNPGVLLAEYTGADWSAPHARMLGAYWGSKNVAFCVVFIFALLTKRVPWLVPLFGFRFISDGIDMIIMTPIYREVGFAEIVLPFLVLGLPSLLAAMALHVRGSKEG